MIKPKPPGGRMIRETPVWMDITLWVLFGTMVVALVGAFIYAFIRNTVG